VLFALLLVSATLDVLVRGAHQGVNVWVGV
jgi:hypothetical protein